jgi:hypothetical protein
MQPTGRRPSLRRWRGGQVLAGVVRGRQPADPGCGGLPLFDTLNQQRCAGPGRGLNLWNDDWQRHGAWSDLSQRG